MLSLLVLASSAALRVATPARPTAAKSVPPAFATPATPRIDTLVEELRPTLERDSLAPSARVLRLLNAELQHTAQRHTRIHTASATSLTFAAAPVKEAPTLSADDALSAEDALPLWFWRAAMMLITACWGTNFAVIKGALDALPKDDASLFLAARFGLSAAALAPWIFSSSSAGAARWGLAVGACCALGYFAQAASLAMGTTPETAAFICSLQAVTVALLSPHVAPRTWVAVGLAVAGIGCLELPAVLGDMSWCARSGGSGSSAAARQGGAENRIAPCVAGALAILSRSACRRCLVSATCSRLKRWSATRATRYPSRRCSAW